MPKADGVVLFLVVVWMAAAVESADGATHTLVWTASTEPTVTGYVVQYGLHPRSYTGKVDVGNSTSWEFTIPEGKTYYFAVRAYAKSGEVSPYSNEVSIFDEPPLSAAMTAPANGSVGIPVEITLAITFSMAVNASTVNPLNFELLDAGNTVVPGTVAYDPMTRTATLDPAARLAPRTTYTAVVRSVTAQSGETLAQNYVWSFTTGATFRGDFSGDGLPNILWRHKTGGWLAVWSMSATIAVATTWLTPSIDNPNMELAGTADFNGDGALDLLWRHQATNALTVWLMNGPAAASIVPISATMSDRSWSIMAVADFNSDGYADLLWQQRSTARLAVWFMRGTTFIEGRWLDTSGLSDGGWQVVGAKDFNEDGRPDLLWQHAKATSMTIWLMRGVEQTGALPIATSGVGDVDWRVRSVIDLNLDGHPDLVWQHLREGYLAVWFMVNGAFSSSNFLTPKTAGDIGWQVVGSR